MVGLSEVAKNLKPSPTLAMSAKARQLTEQGEKVIHLGAGEPKVKVPFDAIMAASAKLVSAEIRYTPTKGIPALVNAIIGYTEQNYNKTVGKPNIIASAGAKQAIYNLLMAVLNPGDEVVLLAPYWVSYPDIVEMHRGVPVVVKAADGGFIPTFEEITGAVTDKTRAIMVNSPNNPSGAVYPPDLIGQLVEFCEEKDVLLVMDDIYHKLVFDGLKAVSPFDYTKKDIEETNVVVLNGVSKAFAMTGFRIGWTVANSKLVSAMTNIAGQNTTCPSGVQQAAAAGALDGNQNGVESLRLILQNNRDIMVRELQSMGGVKIQPPQGTFYCLPDFTAFGDSSVEMSNFLLDKARVVTVPGAEFGMEGYLRVSVCGSVADIIEGVKRIRWALDPESPDEIYIGDKLCKRDWA